MAQHDFKTELNNSDANIDNYMETFFPKDKNDFVRLGRLGDETGGPEYDYDNVKSTVEWSIETGGGRSYLHIYEPLIKKASGSILILRYEEGSDEPEEFEKEWETDSSWELKVRDFGSTEIKNGLAPTYVEVDIDNKILTVDFL